MGRYAPLFLTAFLICLAAAAGALYLPGYAVEQEMEATGSITVYTTLPVEHAALLAKEYEKTNRIKVRFIPLTEKELLGRLKEEAASPQESGDAVLASKEALIKAAQMGAFLPYGSEETDMVSERFKDKDGAWVGVWYDPIVFCANRDYLQSAQILPNSWKKLTEAPNCRIAITDFLAADASANLLYTLVAEYDETQAFALMEKLKPKIVQYAKYLVTPVRMAGMGEVDVSVAVQSESLRYQKEGFPISILYPEEGTAYLLTGTAILKNAPKKREAAEFVHWLTGDDVQMLLQKEGFYFVPVNPMTFAYQGFSGKNLALFENYSDLTPEQKEKVLDRWVKNIRFK